MIVSRVDYCKRKDVDNGERAPAGRYFANRTTALGMTSLIQAPAVLEVLLSVGWRWVCVTFVLLDQ